MKAHTTVIEGVTGGVEADSGLGLEGWHLMGDGGTQIIEVHGGLR